MFLKREEIINRVKESKRLIDAELDKERGRFISAYDTDEGETIIFNFLEFINYDKLFDFGSLKVNKEKFYKILKEKLDPILFLMPKKICFINSQEELDNLEIDDFIEHQRERCLDIEELVGMKWYPDTIVINVKLLKKVAKEEYQYYKDFLSKEEFFNELMWTTLIHELRHMVCDNAIIVEFSEIPFDESEEEKVEEYCQNILNKDIKTVDYVVFE